MRVLFLYSEIADYFLASCKALISKGADVHVVKFAVNKEAPFRFVYPDGIHVYERDNYTDSQLISLVQTIQPNIIVCSGWIDKSYLKVCKKFKNKCLTVLALDNHWKGTLKQKLASIASSFYLKNRFSKCWVPGELQYNYALKLGFKSNEVLTGFYSCDFNLFHNQYLLNIESKKKNFPKRFIFVGRYYDFKGIKDLWNAFIELQNESSNDWELWCLGTGDIEPIKHENIKHFGFVQPQNLPEYIKNTGVFVLPSHFEPWGVVVHEFAAAGFPIICSDEVGAKQAFVENGVNGYIYKAGNIVELKSKLKTIMEMNDADLSKMSDESVGKAKMNTPDIWADKLFSMIQ